MLFGVSGLLLITVMSDKKTARRSTPPHNPDGVYCTSLRCVLHLSTGAMDRSTAPPHHARDLFHGDDGELVMMTTMMVATMVMVEREPHHIPLHKKHSTVKPLRMSSQVSTEQHARPGQHSVAGLPAELTTPTRTSQVCAPVGWWHALPRTPRLVIIC